jgi:hypothetical protein
MRHFLVWFWLCALPVVAQNNILTNSSFETGLMCYSAWVWTPGDNFIGDYHFSLSPDSHSGNSSLEIACTGSNCVRAAIISQHIPAQNNQAYRLSVWAKCAPGSFNTIHVPATASGDITQFLTCDGAWHQNQLSFQTAADFQTGPLKGYMYFYLFNLDKAWLRVDDVVLTYGDGTAPVQAVLHPGVRNTAISGQTLMVDGSPFLSLGFFDVPYSDLAQVAATGANTINGLGNYNAANCFNLGGVSYLDRIYELGMKFVPDSSSTSRLQNSASVSSAVAAYAPHLANIGWFLADEPDLAEVYWYYVPPSTFVTEGSAVKTSTSLPSVADFQRGAWGSTSSVAPYNNSTDIWMAEPYGPDFSGATHAVNLFNSIQRRPIWFAQDDIDASLIVPKAYWAVIGGVTGLHYFTWDVFKSQPAKLAAATQVFSELNGLTNVIFGHKMDTMVTSPSGVASMSRFDPASGSAYILAANSTSQNVQGNFTVSGLAAGTPVTVLYENRTITANTNSFTDTFAGVSRHVYAIHSPNTVLTATLAGKSGNDAKRDWNVQVYNNGLGAANNAQITNMTFTQTGGKACTPTVSAGTFPLSFGTLTPSESASRDIIVNFAACDSTSRFTVNLMLSANGGATSATVVRNNERK